MRIKLDDDRKDRIVKSLIHFVSTEFDEDMSAFRAEAMVDFMLRQIGPSQYNQAITDARKYMAEKIEDLDTEFHEPDDEAGES